MPGLPVGALVEREMSKAHARQEIRAIALAARGHRVPRGTVERTNPYTPRP